MLAIWVRLPWTARLDLKPSLRVRRIARILPVLVTGRSIRVTTVERNTMSWITIEKEKCNLCGLCATRCAKNFILDGDEMTAVAGEGTCMLCGHCVALCPTDALYHEKLDMDNFVILDRKSTIEREEFTKLVRARRSIRHYKDKKVPREDLEALVDLTRYAPTGSNSQQVGIVVIENEEKIARLSKLTAERMQEIYPQDENAEKPAEYVDWIFFNAPALMIFHFPKSPSTADCVIAAQTVVLASMTMGLGTCYIGMLEYAWHTSDEVKAEVNLPEGHSMGSVLILGYPKLTFLRSVDRFPMRVRWE